MPRRGAAVAVRPHGRRLRGGGHGGHREVLAHRPDDGERRGGVHLVLGRHDVMELPLIAMIARRRTGAAARSALLIDHRVHLVRAQAAARSERADLSRRVRALARYLRHHRERPALRARPDHPDHRPVPGAARGDRRHRRDHRPEHLAGRDDPAAALPCRAARRHHDAGPRDGPRLAGRHARGRRLRVQRLVPLLRHAVRLRVDGDHPRRLVTRRLHAGDQGTARAAPQRLVLPHRAALLRLRHHASPDDHRAGRGDADRLRGAVAAAGREIRRLAGHGGHRVVPDGVHPRGHRRLDHLRGAGHGGLPVALPGHRA